MSTAGGGHLTPSAVELESREKNLWQRLRDGSDAFARAELITHFQPYARVMAAVLYKGRTHDDIEFDEYLQFASIGLIEAVDRYDCGREAHFKTFAAHRIRGAVLTGLERLSEKNQQIAFQKRIRRERLEAIKAGASTTTGFEAHQKNPSQNKQETLLAYLAEVGIGVALGVMLEGTGMILDAQEEEVVASPEISYFKKSEARQLQARLRDVLARLPEPERRVIRFHYQQGIAFEEISRMMGLTKGRISQLHRRALEIMRGAMGQGPSVDVVW